MMTTQDLINRARQSEYMRAPCADKCDWLQFAETHTPAGKLLEVEVRSVGNTTTGTRITRSTFYRGSLRIGRKVAEALLAAEE